MNWGLTVTLNLTTFAHYLKKITTILLMKPKQFTPFIEPIYDKIALRLSVVLQQLERLISYAQAAILSLILFIIVSFYGFSAQYAADLLFKFSYSNIGIAVVSVLYLITISQYFLLKDRVIWFYGLYLFLNVCFFHYSVFNVENTYQSMGPFVRFFFGVMLIGGYYLYTKFTIYFLDIEKTHPLFAKRLHVYAFIYLMLLILYIVVLLYFYAIQDEDRIFYSKMIIVCCCIPVGLLGISECYLRLRGTLSYIFLAGTTAYFVGSMLGFFIGGKLIDNPFTNPVMKNWLFFTETGTVIEVTFFSIGLAYRMRLIAIEKQKIEQELLISRVKELETEQALLQQRERISQDLHDDIGSKLSSISILSQVVLNKMPTGFDTKRLESIGSHAREVLGMMDDIVWSVNPKNDSIQQIIERMKIFAIEILEEQNIQLNLIIDDHIHGIALSAIERKDTYLIFKEAVNNAAKYADATVVTIRLQKENTHLLLQIEDNGKGFDRDIVRSGNGLKNMNSRAKNLGGTLTINSKPHEGTNILLTLPIK
jgi:signal transduction histidine kinase